LQSFAGIDQEWQGILLGLENPLIVSSA